MNRRPITIVGGGVAGLTLGIGLRARGVPVTLWEAGHYPRHRVCGEFISGRGLEVLKRVGVHISLMKAGAIAARDTVFFLGKNASPVRMLEPSALGLSRYKLDEVLAHEFRERGGDLHENARWQGSGCAEGTVLASGRRAQGVENGWRWFGVKAHARNVELSADLEMHCFPDRYVGLSRVEDNRVNVCGLFRRRLADGPPPRNRRDLLLGDQGSPLRTRLERAVLDEGSFCAVAGLSLRSRRAADYHECCIGDALTMISPATGNGMSMAIEAAEVALGPLAAYTRGEVCWENARQTIAQRCDKLFCRRLLWGAWLHRLLFLGCRQKKLGPLLLRSEFLWRLMFRNTR